jgi:hypothetical protein
MCAQELELCVALGGLVVSVLATGPKVRGFKPGRGRWMHVKEPYEHDRYSSAKFSHVSHPRFTCFAARWQTNQD